MRYDLVATLGPSSDAESVWKAMLSAGVTAFRLNTSHLSLSQLHRWLDRLEGFSSPCVSPFSLILDLQGSKWRLGECAARELTVGQPVELAYATAVAHKQTLPVPHADFFQAALVSNGEIIVNDARVKLQIDAIDAESLLATVTKGGELSARKGITFADSRYRQEHFSDKDRDIIAQTRHLASIRYAVSYIKDAVEMARYRALLGASAYLIAKLERKTAMQDADQIAEIASEVWVCRGDLGAELGLSAMAEAVHQISTTIRDLRAPALMAGQLFEHLCRNATPTRSEICYLFDILNQGYRGIVLSDETAIGLYPIESCRAAALFLR